ncbi:MAG: 4-phosphoerythronate dehydrogenase PdxB [Prolixibacteraceae bacterium]|jgi:erythronate-4-phosphate dehydrogenase|nr:4-phosphoerythronate dehydrogenase PdxB [Prolixibacteraceae bacterium]
MKVIIDNKIPYIQGALEPFAEVVYLPGSETTKEIAKNADAIITRTRTLCNAELLKDSKVKMIATATIGFDHIDTQYCNEAGIEWTNAPGCNSWSVAQYIMATLFSIAKRKRLQLDELTIGIVGAGNVGSKVAKLSTLIGMNVLVNDPPRQRIEGDTNFVSLKEIQENADIVTFHTPLNKTGEDKTYHLANEDFISNCKKNVVFINSSRGGVMDTKSILNALNNGKISEAIIDCWENEPNINLELLEKAFITTPHIAGYSKDGKAKGTSMSIQAISRKFHLGIDNWECSTIEKPENSIISINGKGKSKQAILSEAILSTYPIQEDSNRLKTSVQTFEKQRGDYPVRREFPYYKIEASNVPSEIIELLKRLGFQI